LAGPASPPTNQEGNAVDWGEKPVRGTFRSELEALKQEIVEVSQMVVSMMDQAILSLARQDLALARQVIDRDDEVDRRVIDLEMKALQMIALRQPMARDLRTVGTGLKLVTDLERMADHAVDIAEIVIRLGDQPLVKPLVDVPRMAELTREMTEKALRAYVREDEALARAMIEMDHEVDRRFRLVFDELMALMERDPGVVKQATYLLHVAKHLERIGDHATNLGEWIIYMVTGELQDLNQ